MRFTPKLICRLRFDEICIMVHWLVNCCHPKGICTGIRIAKGVGKFSLGGVLDISLLKELKLWEGGEIGLRKRCVVWQ